MKQVFSSFNIYGRVFEMLNESTSFQIAAMTEEDFDNMNFGKVCEQWKPTGLFLLLAYEGYVFTPVCLSTGGCVYQHALKVSRPTQRGEVEGSDLRRSPGPHPRGRLRGLQAHTQGGWEVSRLFECGLGGGCPTCTEAPPAQLTATAAGGTHPTGMHSGFISRWLLPPVTIDLDAGRLCFHKRVSRILSMVWYQSMQWAGWCTSSRQTPLRAQTPGQTHPWGATPNPYPRMATEADFTHLTGMHYC